MSKHDDDFWGGQSDWSPRTEERVGRRADTERSGPVDVVRRGWNQVLGGGADVTREHGIVRPAAPRPTEAALDATPTQAIRRDLCDDLDDDVDTPLAVVTVNRGWNDGDGNNGDWNNDAHNDGWDAEFVAVLDERPIRSVAAGIDPLIARIGALAVVTVLLIPLFLGFTSGEGGDDLLESGALPGTASAVAPVPTLLTPLIEPEPTAETQPAGAAEPGTPPAAPLEAATTAAQPIDAALTEPTAASSTQSASTGLPATATLSTVAADSSEGVSRDLSGAVTVDEPATRVEPVCAIEYEVVGGDYWIRLADAAGVPLAELLGSNGATVNTPLFPGSTICLPAGSKIPPPPVATTAPPTTAPTTTAPRTTTPATTTPPATQPPTTVRATTSDVQQIIRNVWPDQLEDRAIEIAFRESRFVPTAQNFCCYGIFQIYWTVHRSWLDDIGITSSQQLFDPQTNARAAYALYQRAGGWGPWGF